MAAPHYPDIGTIAGVAAPKRAEAQPVENIEDLRIAQKVAEAKAEQAEALLRDTISPKPPQLTDLGPPIPGEMPDPTDTEPYRAWVQATRERDRWEARNYTERVRDAAVSAGRSDRIIDEYMAAHPKYQHLRQQVFEAFKAVCVEKNLTQLPDDFTVLNAAVDKKMAALVKAAAAAIDDLPTGDPNPTDETPPSRTAGLSAGSKGSSASGSTPEEEDGIKIKSMFDVIRDRQSASGLF